MKTYYGLGTVAAIIGVSRETIRRGVKAGIYPVSAQVYEGPYQGPYLMTADDIRAVVKDRRQYKLFVRRNVDEWLDTHGR